MNNHPSGPGIGDLLDLASAGAQAAPPYPYGAWVAGKATTWARGVVLAVWVALILFYGLIGPTHAQQSVFVPATTTQISVTGTVATATKIVTGVAGKQIYVTMVSLIPVPTSVVTFTYGTGTNCGTGTTSVTGAMTFGAGQVLDIGTGNGALWVLPQGVDLCITIATAAAPGSLAYSLF